MLLYNSVKRLLSISLIFLLAACSERAKGQEELPVQTAPIINYLALGDSYTIGQGVSILERWPNQLIVRLEENDFKVERFQIIAQTSWTTGNLITAINDEEIGDYNLVSLLIGVNNQFQNLAFSVFREEFNQLLDTAIQIANGKERVFVVSIPDYGVTPFGSTNAAQIGTALDQYNAYISERCRNQGITFINVTEISRELGDAPGALASDNLHPSGEQYSEWVDAILPGTLELLSQ
ncbi:MAG: SGNH/GDSL hydrolase family protein [Flavobacteriaceae bacterium]